MSRLTKREWKSIVMQRTGTDVTTRHALAEAERMIDNGETWAPEPVTEADVRRWLHADPRLSGPLIEHDLATAMERCRRAGGSASIQAPSEDVYALHVVWPGDHHDDAYSTDLTYAAKYFAAWAYSKAHPDADVQHLIKATS